MCLVFRINFYYTKDKIQNTKYKDMNLNKAIVAGNLTRDPEVRAIPSGQTVVSFNVATNRAWTDRNGQKQESAEFHNIVAFGKLADICSRYLAKGRLVLIEGRIQTRSWQGQDGLKRYRTEIIADNMQMGPRQTAESFTGQVKTTAVKDIIKEEIPVIEAEEMPGFSMQNTLETENKQTEEPELSTESDIFEDKDKGQVKIKDIPF